MQVLDGNLQVSTFPSLSHAHTHTLSLSLSLAHSLYMAAVLVSGNKSQESRGQGASDLVDWFRLGIWGSAFRLGVWGSAFRLGVWGSASRLGVWGSGFRV